MKQEFLITGGGGGGGGNISITTSNPDTMFLQGGSDKSGMLKIFLENHTAQLKIIRFY